ncbi:MAG TPA: hypothetical protein VEY12_05110 [Thermoplasmata archaeon]|nr:hypothetical protein [Thermoplasmata archaeon]
MRLEGSSHRDPLEANVFHWLLEEDQPSVRYLTLVDLLGRKADDPEVKAGLSKIARAGWAHDLLRAQKPKGYWEAHEPRTVREWVNFLRFPLYDSSIWKGIVLSDLGLTATEPRVRRFADRIFEYKLHLSSEVNLFTEEVCIVGNVARMLTRFGYGDDRRVRKLYDWMLEDQREDGGWNCSQGTPGTLDAWEPLAAYAALPSSKRPGTIERSISRGAEFYLERRLFHEGRRYAPWFRFHYPNHYFYDILYDILVGLDVITRLGFADDRRLGPALKILSEKRRPDGTWVLDAVHPDVEPGAGSTSLTKKYKRFTLEAPGEPSKWITLTALRVLKRVEDAG